MSAAVSTLCSPAIPAASQRTEQEAPKDICGRTRSELVGSPKGAVSRCDIFITFAAVVRNSKGTENSSLLDDLNDAQKAAVLYVDGSSLIVAGAGSGKTRVLTHKIAYLLQLGYRSHELLALTFTNKAADEMRRRVEDLIGTDTCRGMWMGTFHSIFNRILKRECGRLGYSPSYTIYQPSDCEALIRAIIKERGLDKQVYKYAAIASWISRAKNNLMTPDMAAEQGDLTLRLSRNGLDSLVSIYAQYCERMKQANAMDFDDLLLNIYLLFDSFTEVKRRWASEFRFILVDEYQDTNLAQHEILQQLCSEYNHLCVVGDDAQSIYGFRGARIDNILSFTKLYEGARLFRLERNYRSTQSIVAAANSLIGHNKGQIKKNIFSKGDEGEPLVLSVTENDRLEGKYVARKIEWLHDHFNLDYDEIAILYRTNTQSRIFEEELRMSGIPYVMHNGRSFYERKEIRDVLALFRFVINPDDEAAFRRVIVNVIDGIGATTVEKVVATAIKEGLSIGSVLNDISLIKVNKSTEKRLLLFNGMITDWKGKLLTEDAFTLGRRILNESGLAARAHADKDEEHLQLQEGYSELLNALSGFTKTRQEEGLDRGLTDFLDMAALLSDADQKDDDCTEHVKLMTIHAAKGLEFDAVFIVGLEKGLFPSERAMGLHNEIEEERRLFYVAITRAKKYCFLSLSRMRYRHGVMEITDPSPFIKEIDSRHLKYESLLTPRQSRSASQCSILLTDGSRRFRQQFQPELQSGKLSRIKRSHKPSTAENENVEELTYNNETLRKGQRVLHSRYGKGTVISLKGPQNDGRAVIEFDGTGTKTLLLRFARFTLIE